MGTFEPSITIFLMLTRLLFVALVLMSLPSCFPKPVTDPYGPAYWATYYQEKLEPGARLLEVGPLYTLESSRGLYHLRTYFFDTKTLISDEYFVDRNLDTRQGTATYYTDLGQKRKVVRYLTGTVQDTVVEFHPANGQISGKIPYVDGKRNGVKSSYDEEGHLIELSTYKNDQLDGEVLRFESDGTLKSREIFKAGEYIPDPERDTVEVIQSLPEYRCSPKFSAFPNCAERTLQSYLASNVRYPSDAFKYGIQGKAVISFVVGKDGQVSDINVERGICASIQRECIRIVKGMEVWKPGMSGDHPVKVRFTLPINFRLE